MCFVRADSNASIYTWQLELSGVPVHIEVTLLFRILRSDWLTRFSNMLTQQCQEILRKIFGRAHVRVWERDYTYTYYMYVRTYVRTYTWRLTCASYTAPAPARGTRQRPGCPVVCTTIDKVNEFSFTLSMVRRGRKAARPTRKQAETCKCNRSIFATAYNMMLCVAPHVRT